MKYSHLNECKRVQLVRTLLSMSKTHYTAKFYLDNLEHNIVLGILVPKKKKLSLA